MFSALGKADMSKNSKELKRLLLEAERGGFLMKSSAENIGAWLGEKFLPEWAENALLELFRRRAFEELNDRFFKRIEFGTGGMRGRTIGKVPAFAELGRNSPQGTPEHAAVGSNNMNDFNVVRATMGLFNYCKKYSKKSGLKGSPRLVVAHDTRHFSGNFCDLAASTWTKLGGEAFVFGSPRSTPQLSFTVRNLGAMAGIVITASHNPYHDNGYKVYFSDGAQATSPHAEGIVAEVAKVKFSQTAKFLKVSKSKVKKVPKSSEDAYLKAIEESVIDGKIIKKVSPKAVFTSVHGTGAVMCPKILEKFGVKAEFVEEQMEMDPRFPTVKQPNPEYSETLQMALTRAEESGADFLMATDPDSDRLGTAIRCRNGKMRLLTGNMVGCMLAEYRASKMEELGIITSPANCAIIKTFVTTPLQDKIAARHGIKCVNCLTGFKWIGSRLTKYESELESAAGSGFRKLPYSKRAELFQRHSTFFVFGGEESYGYLGTDLTRDKDANAAALMFCEMMASLKSKGITADEFLDEIYLKCGYFLEDLKSVYREGAKGAAAISSFLNVLDEKPLEEVAGIKVAKSVNFAKDEIFDADNVRIPKEKFFFYTLENGYSFAIRGSGTEPKIKFYAFAQENAKNPKDLKAAKAAARNTLDKVLEDLERKFELYSKD